MSALSEPVVAREFVQADIVLVHPFARRDMGGREADDLAELADRLTLADRLDRHLVALENALAGGKSRRVCALGHEIDCDDDIVVRMKADGTGGGHRAPGFGYYDAIGKS